MRTDLFDFVLPEDRIALRPTSPRDAARLLVVRAGVPAQLEDRSIRDLPELLRAGDAVNLERSQVSRPALHASTFWARSEDWANAEIGQRLRQASTAPKHFRKLNFMFLPPFER